MRFFAMYLLAVLLAAGVTQQLAVASTPELPAPEIVLSRLLETGELGTGLPDSVIQYLNQAELEYLPRVLQINIQHREETSHYQHLHLPQTAETCREFLNEQRDTLQVICDTYGADPAILAAIWFTESRLGENTGDYKVRDLFFTLTLLAEPEVVSWNIDSACENEPDRDPEEVAETVRKRSQRKRKWALRELNTLLELYPAAVLESLQGSWAGAAGIPQFLPSSILGYGIDWNQDGVVNMHQFGDAAASTANYLKRNGWRQSPDEEQRRRAIWNYNHSQPYVDGVLYLYHQLEQ